MIGRYISEPWDGLFSEAIEMPNCHPSEDVETRSRNPGTIQDRVLAHKAWNLRRFLIQQPTLGFTSHQTIVWVQQFLINQNIWNKFVPGLFKTMHISHTFTQILMDAIWKCLSLWAEHHCVPTSSTLQKNTTFKTYLRNIDIFNRWNYHIDQNMYQTTRICIYIYTHTVTINVNVLKQKDSYWIRSHAGMQWSHDSASSTGCTKVAQGFFASQVVQDFSQQYEILRFKNHNFQTSLRKLAKARGWCLFLVWKMDPIFLHSIPTHPRTKKHKTSYRHQGGRMKQHSIFFTSDPLSLRSASPGWAKTLTTWLDRVPESRTPLRGVCC